MEERECFVCADTVPSPWPSACHCRDRFIHEACLKKLLETHGPICTVCKERFSNVIEKEEWVFRPSCTSCGMWLLLLAGVIIGACVVNTTLHFFHRPFGSTTSVTLLLVIICFFVVFMVTVTMWSWLLIFRYGCRVLFGFASRETRSTYRIKAPDEDTRCESP